MAPAPPRPPPRVLFVHNGVPYQRHVDHLKQAGLQVSEVHVDEALQTATSQQPDIVVLDFGCDGDTIRAFKQNAQTQHLPVIALVEMLKP